MPPFFEIGVYFKTEGPNLGQLGVILSKLFYPLYFCFTLFSKVQGGSFSPKKTGPFAMTGKGVTPKAQSARAKMTSYAQSQNTKTVVRVYILILVLLVLLVLFVLLELLLLLLLLLPPLSPLVFFLRHFTCTYKTVFISKAVFNYIKNPQAAQSFRC